MGILIRGVPFLPATVILLVAIGTTFAAPALGANSGPDSYRVFKSLDRGETWIRSDDGLPTSSRINAFGSMGSNLVAGTDSGIFVSEDQGAHWSPAPGFASSFGRVLCFAVHGETLLAGASHGGLLRSLDRGHHWNRVPQFTANVVRSLVSVGKTLYAGTDADGIWMWTEGSTDWEQFGPGLPADAQIFSLTVWGGEVYAGLYSRGLYRGNRTLKRWEKVDPVRPLSLAQSAGNLIAGQNPGGLHWSSDVGRTWNPGILLVQEDFETPSTNRAGFQEFPVWDMAAGEGLVFAGAANGIYRSADGGRTWTPSLTGIEPPGPGIAFLVRDDVVLSAIGLLYGSERNKSAAGDKQTAHGN